LGRVFDFWIYPLNGSTPIGPPFLLLESFRSGTHGVEPHQRDYLTNRDNLSIN
jgi:hypothetical protein